MLRPFFRASVPIPGGHSQVARLLSFLAIYFSASSALILSLPPGASASPTRQRCAQAAAAIGFAVSAAKVHQALRPPRAKSAPLSPQSPEPPECRREYIASVRQPRLPFRPTQLPALVPPCSALAAPPLPDRESAHSQTSASAKFHRAHTACRQTLPQPRRTLLRGKHPASVIRPSPQEPRRGAIARHLQQSLRQSRDCAPPDCRARRAA